MTRTMPHRIANLLARLVPTLAALTLLAACSEGPMSTGPVRTETRPVENFDSIDVRGAVRLTITVGVPASLEVEGRDPFLERLQTEVHGDTLRIKVRRRDWAMLGTSPRPIVRIGVPTLEAFEAQGGNVIHLNGLNGGETKIRLKGANNLVAIGKLDELRVFMAGAGHADLGDVMAKQAAVTVAGVGSVLVHPIESLDATMNGVGAIFYTGNPGLLNTRIHGLGAIEQRNANDFRRGRDQPEPSLDPESLQPEYDHDEPVEKEAVEDVTLTEVL